MYTKEEKILEEVKEINEIAKNIGMKDMLLIANRLEITENNREYYIKYNILNKCKNCAKIGKISNFLEMEKAKYIMYKYLVQLEAACQEDLKIYPDNKKIKSLIPVIESLVKTTSDSFFETKKDFEKNKKKYFSNQQELVEFVAMYFANNYIEYLESQKSWAMDEREEYCMWEDRIELETNLFYEKFKEVLKQRCETKDTIKMNSIEHSIIFIIVLRYLGNDLKPYDVFYPNREYLISQKQNAFYMS